MISGWEDADEYEAIRKETVEKLRRASRDDLAEVLEQAAIINCPAEKHKDFKVNIKNYEGDKAKTDKLEDLKSDIEKLEKKNNYKIYTLNAEIKPCQFIIVVNPTNLGDSFIWEASAASSRI